METTTEDGKGRIPYNAKERRNLIAEFNRSGLTPAAFCREWSIHPAMFSGWLHSEYGEEPKVSFCEVETVPEVNMNHEVRIRQNIPVFSSPEFWL